MKYFLFFSLLLCSFSLQAQTSVMQKRDPNQPVEIQSDHLEVIQANKVAIFSGNVEAKQGDVHLKADEMRVYYKEKDEGKDKKAAPKEKKPGDTAAAPPQNSISKIDVQGNVFLATPQETAQGTKGVYDVEKSTITLTENVVVTREKNVLKGSWLVYNLDTGQSEMKGDAVDKDGKKQRVRGVFVPEKAKKE